MRLPDTHIHEHDPCLQCGYSLHSLAHGQSCPECGKPVGQSRKERRMARRRGQAQSAMLKKMKRWAYNAIAVVGFTVGMTIFILELSTLRVSCRDFCPQTFHVRERTWHEVPFARWKMTGETVAARGRLSVGDALVKHGWLADSDDGRQWHAVDFPMHIMTPRRSDIRFRGFFLKVNGKAGDLLVKWTDEHPVQAQMLWPALLRELNAGRPESPFVADSLLYQACLRDSVTAKPKEFQRMIDDLIQARQPAGGVLP